MAYDLKPLETMKEKKVLHDVATDGKHFLFFEHDLDVACGFLTKNENGRVVFGGEVNIADII